MNKVFVGIDPGKQGFIVLYHERYKEHEFLTMPFKSVGTGEFKKTGAKEEKTELVFDVEGFKAMILDINDRYGKCSYFGVIEDVNGRQGWSAQNNFAFGKVAGMQEMILIMLGATYIAVRPQKWQSIMYRGIEKVMTPSSTGKTMVHDTKATSEKVARQMYPHIDFRRDPTSKRSTKIDDNKTDAFLMCEYARIHAFKNA